MEKILEQVQPLGIPNGSYTRLSFVLGIVAAPDGRELSVLRAAYYRHPCEVVHELRQEAGTLKVRDCRMGRLTLNRACRRIIVESIDPFVATALPPADLDAARIILGTHFPDYTIN